MNTIVQIKGQDMGGETSNSAELTFLKLYHQFSPEAVSYINPRQGP